MRRDRGIQRLLDMPPRSGKTDEEGLLRAFLHRLAVEPTHITADERPDFDVDIGDVRIGCEVTRFFDKKGRTGSLGAQALVEWQRFCRDFSKVPAADNLLVLGTLHFANGPLRVGVEDDEHAECHRRLLQFTRSGDARHELRLLVQAEFRGTPISTTVDGTKYPELAKSVYEVGLHPSPEVAHWWASHLQSGPVSDPLPLLHEIVLEKAHKSADYRTAARTELWLLIVADGAQIETIGVLFEETLEGWEPPSTGGFTRVFHWDGFSEQVWQLYPTPALLSDAATRTLHMRAYPECIRAACTVK